MKKEVLYKLETKLPYAKAGQMVEGEFIALTAPTSKNMVECAALKQAFFRALPKVTPDAAAKSDDISAEIDGASVMALITMSKDVDLSSVLITAKELFASGLALIDGEVKLTKPLIDTMAQDDLEAMTGEFMANFILASALQRLRKN